MTSPSASAGHGRLVLAIDSGTTTTKVVLVDPVSGASLSEASAPTTTSFPSPGWVEQDAAEIWQATLAAVDACLAGVPDARLGGIGISNQRETVVCWSRSTGVPLGPALGWQDARTAAWCDELLARRPEAAELVRSRTGLGLDPMFSAPKMRRAIDTAVAAGADPTDVAVGTVDTWLLFNLTGEHATDVGNASRTMLLDLETLDWSPDLTELFGVERVHLPEARPSDASFGATRASLGRLGAGVPVLAVLADSHAAMYLHGCTEPGAGKATYGTGSSVMTPTSDARPAPDGIATTVAWHTGGRATYAREGNVLATGSALDWMARVLGADGIPGGRYLTDLAADVADSDGVVFVPAFSGLGAPYWDRAATGVVTGVSGGTRPAHLALAALEAVAHQVTDVVEAMEADGSARVEVLHADGGATASRRLMQVQADLLDRPLEVADVPGASAMGAAVLASRSLGVDPPSPQHGDRVLPGGSGRAAARRAWADAVARSRGLPVPAHPTSTPS